MLWAREDLLWSQHSPPPQARQARTFPVLRRLVGFFSHFISKLASRESLLISDGQALMNH